MKYPPLEARVVLIDGPVSIFLHVAPQRSLTEAYTRLGRLVTVAAQQLHEENRNVFAQSRAATADPTQPLSEREAYGGTD